MFEERIALYDISTPNHYIYLYTICKIFLNNKKKVTVFCSSELRDKLITMDLDKGNIEFVVFKKGQNKLKYLKYMSQICNKYINTLWINTLELTFIENIYFMIIKPKVYSVLTIHNVNSWLKKDLFSYIRGKENNITKIKNSLYFIQRRLILNRFQAINVLEDNLKCYIEEKKIYDKKIFCLPFSIVEEKNTPIVYKEYKSIVIPGTITSKRRNYNDIIQILSENNDLNIKLILLGRPVDKSGLEIINKCSLLKKRGIHIKVFDNFIAEEDFIKELQGADFILGDLNRSYNNMGCTEIYGETKSTGVIFNMIRFSLPGILPNWYKIDKKMETSILQYKSIEDLSLIFNEISKMNMMELKKIKDNAINNSAKFSLDRYCGFYL